MWSLFIATLRLAPYEEEPLGIAETPPTTTKKIKLRAFIGVFFLLYTAIIITIDFHDFKLQILRRLSRFCTFLQVAFK